MANICNIKQHTVRSSENFFFDCNIWMFNYCPIANYSKAQQKTYSTFFKDILSSRATIITNSMVLSEFVNRYLRLDYNLWLPTQTILQPDFKKDYVGSDQYKQIVPQIKNALTQIQKSTTPFSDDFNRISGNLESVLNHFSEIDFNDSYHYEFCKLNNFILVSDDKDFQKISDSSVKVLTQNI